MPLDIIRLLILKIYSNKKYDVQFEMCKKVIILGITKAKTNNFPIDDKTVSKKIFQLIHTRVNCKFYLWFLNEKLKYIWIFNRYREIASFFPPKI